MTNHYNLQPPTAPVGLERGVNPDQPAARTGPMITSLQHANANRITGNLWIGGDLETTYPTLARIQLDELDAAGLSDIIDCRIEWNDHDWVSATKPHIGYLWLGVDDAGQRMRDAWFETGTRHTLARLAAGGTVLTHCHMGINRGPSMGFAALLALGWDPIDALDRIRQRRPIANVAYAEDALDWWLRKQDASRHERREGRARILHWRRRNHLNVTGIIRRIRQRESA